MFVIQGVCHTGILSYRVFVIQGVCHTGCLSYRDFVIWFYVLWDVSRGTGRPVFTGILYNINWLFTFIVQRLVYSCVYM